MNIREILGFSALLLFPSLAAGQSSWPPDPPPVWLARPRVETFASIALGHVFRFDDRSFGNHANAGAGVEATVWRGLRAGAELNRTFGLSASPVKCGAISTGPGQTPLPCTGSAREGVGSATAASFTASYFFGTRRLQPYVLGGLSILHAKVYSASSIVRGDHVEFQEHSTTDTGIGMTFGFGLRACVTRRLSIRPEFRFSDGSALSSANLSQMRLSLSLAYGW